MQSRQCIHFSHMQSKDLYDETYETSAEHVHIAHIMIISYYDLGLQYSYISHKKNARPILANKCHGHRCVDGMPDIPIPCQL